jgi:hypothetical protein
MRRGGTEEGLLPNPTKMVGPILQMRARPLAPPIRIPASMGRGVGGRRWRAAARANAMVMRRWLPQAILLAPGYSSLGFENLDGPLIVKWRR